MADLPPAPAAQDIPVTGIVASMEAICSRMEQVATSVARKRVHEEVSRIEDEDLPSRGDSCTSPSSAPYSSPKAPVIDRCACRFDVCCASAGRPPTADAARAENAREEGEAMSEVSITIEMVH